MSIDLEIEAAIYRTHEAHGGTDKDWPQTPHGIHALLTAANVLMIRGWRPIAEFKMPETTSRTGFHERHRMLFQLARRGDTLPWVCEGYAQLALTGKRPNQRAVTRFYEAGGRWLVDGVVDFFMLMPEPRDGPGA